LKSNYVTFSQQKDGCALRVKPSPSGQTLLHTHCAVYDDWILDKHNYISKGCQLNLAHNIDSNYCLR